MIAALLTLPLAAFVLPVQDDGPPAQPPTLMPPGATRNAGPLVASDGQPLAAGRIPADTDEQAKAAWQRMLAATTTGAGRPPIRSFDLAFDILFRHAEGKNQFDARYIFKADEGFLRCETKKSRRVQLRGPEGNFLIEKGVNTELTGRENKVSLREMDEWVSIARNFIALTDAGAIRIVSLRHLAELPLPLPPNFAKSAVDLEWIEVRSPDFRLYELPKNRRSVPIYRALLGLRPNGEAAFAILDEDGSRNTVLESTLLVEVPRWIDVDGYHVPGQLRVFRLDPRSRPRTFSDRESTDLWLDKGGRFNPELDMSIFVPPK